MQFLKNKKNSKMALLILGLLALSVIVYGFMSNPKNASQNREKGSAPNVNKDINLQDDFTGAKVSKEDLIRGCFGKDCIPSIDSPKFENASDANWLTDSDIVFATDYKGTQKAYPQRILNWHEIVNDTISGESVIVTFCPLCGSALGFKRIVNGVVTEFGVSGFLHDNDLVMYDRSEGNLWQQITGAAIVGPAARRDEVLEQIPIITSTWKDWKSEFPNTLVLSRDTGYSRDYNAYPYGTYEEDDTLLFGVKNLDKSLQIKTVVYGIEINGASKAYPEEILKNKKRIKDSLGGAGIEINYKDSGEVEVVDSSSKKIIPIRLFWFAWAAFHPDTLLYR